MPDFQTTHMDRRKWSVYSELMSMENVDLFSIDDEVLILGHILNTYFRRAEFKLE